MNLYVDFFIPKAHARTRTYRVAKLGLYLKYLMYVPQAIPRVCLQST